MSFRTTGEGSRSFGFRGLLAAALLVGAALYAPVFAGRIPLPADVVLASPAWDEIRASIPPAPRHAEMGDLVTMAWVWRSYAGESLRQGRLPLWNPRIFLGTPFLANLTSAVFYPPNLLPALLPLPFAWALAFVLRTSLSFLFSALLARELGASRSGQLLAGLVFSLGGFAVVWQGWPQSDVAAWLPACVLAFERLAKRPGPLRAAFAALALAMAFLAGHPETFLYVSGTTAAWVAFRLALPPERENGPATRRAAAAWSAAALLAVPALVAVQLLPFLEWMGQLSRGFDTVWAWRAPWSALVALVSRDGRSNPNSIQIEVPEWACYAGALTLALVPFAILSRRRAVPLFFLGGAALVVSVLYGHGPLSELAGRAPFLRSLPQARLLLVLGFCLAVLAGLGLTELQRTAGRPGAGLWGARLLSLGLVVVAGVSLYRVGLRSAAPERAFEGRWGIASSLVFLGLTVVLVSASAFRRPGSAALGVAAVVLAGADLASFAFAHVPFTPARLAFPEPEVYRVLRSFGGAGGRVLSVDDTLAPNMEVLFGLSTPLGYDSPSRLHRRLLDPLTDRTVPSFVSSVRAARLVGAAGRRLDLLAVRWLLATTWNESERLLAASPERFRKVRSFGSLVLFENLRALPRAYLVPAAGARVATEEEAWAALDDPAFEPEKSVLLDRWAAALPPPAAEARAGRVLALEDQGERVDLVLDVPDRSVLVLADAWFPGWEVEVDGRPTLLLRANAAFRAVDLPAGTKTVGFRYRPRSVRVGAAVSLAGLAAVLAAVFFGRRPPDPASAGRTPPPSASRGARSPRRRASSAPCVTRR